MTWFQNGNARIYYEDVGQGELIISNHGLGEDCCYWSETGITGKLAEQYRVISMDMRGHGRTVIVGAPYGYDADTMAADFDALANHLGVDKFHLLTHATGGMVGVRYAMTRSARLLSLILTDTGSATRPRMPGMENLSEAEIQRLRREAAKTPIPSYDERIAQVRANPGPFLFKMAEHPECERMWKVFEGFLQRADPQATKDFRLSFYTDPDPRIEGLRNISCPTLVLLGEHDIVFLEPSEIMAREIPDTKHVIIENVGHMTAIECPERTAVELLTFLGSVGKKQ